MIEVKILSEADPMQFQVTIQERGSTTQHRVSAEHATLKRLSAGRVAPCDLVEGAFRFLLDREPKESILGSFDISVISHYFPEFEGALPDYLN